MSRVLIVDDEPLVLSLLSRVLRESGFETLEAATGWQALDMLAADAREIDVLVTDLKMPGISGQELAARVVQDHPQVRVVYMSGFADREAAGVDSPGAQVEFLEKPFTRKSLVETIMRVVPEHMRPATPLRADEFSKE